MGLPVVSGSIGLPVTWVGNGLPVTEAANKRGIAVQQVAKGGLPVTYVMESGAVVPIAPPFTADTWNPADHLNGTLSNGNLTATGTASGGTRGTSSQNSGKYYFEETYNVVNTNTITVGVATPTANMGSLSTGVAIVARSSGQILVNGSLSGSSLGVVIAAGSVVGVAVDLTARLIWYRVAPSGNWNGSGTANPATGTEGVSISAITGPLFPLGGYGNGDKVTANFGASAFSGAVPSGFTAGWPAFVPAVTATTLDPATGTNIALSNANLTAVAASAAQAQVRGSSSKTSGKYYFEVTGVGASQNAAIGISTSTPGGTVLVPAQSLFVNWANGICFINSSPSGGVVNSPINSGDVICCAVNMDNKRIWLRRNGTFWNNDIPADPATNINGLDISSVFASAAAFPVVTFNSTGLTFTANFGAAAFAQAVPSGFTAGWPA